jgi:chorismate mutase
VNTVLADEIADLPVTQDAAVLRFQIDELDRAIQRLMEERAKVSRRIQFERIRSGGARVDLSRENEILSGYSSSMGEVGKDFGLAVLAYCRGELNAPDVTEG